MRALRQRIRPQAVGNVDKQVADHLLFDTLHAQVPGTPCHRRNQGTAQGTTHGKAKSKGPGHRQNKGSSTATLLRRLLRLDDRQDTAQGLRTGSLHPRSAEKHAQAHDQAQEPGSPATPGRNHRQRNTEPRARHAAGLGPEIADRLNRSTSTINRCLKRPEILEQIEVVRIEGQKRHFAMRETLKEAA